MPSSGGKTRALDRKSTRLNSSHGSISYAVFCLKQKHRRPSPPTHRRRAARRRDRQPPSRHVAGPLRRVVVRAVLDAATAERVCVLFFFLMIGRPPGSPLFPYTSLFR